MTDKTETSAPPERQSVTVPLANPVKREGGDVTSLTLRKPKGGDLRGLSLQKLLQSDVDSILAVLPRITDPFLTDAECNALEAEDLAEIGGALFGFFMTPAQKAMMEQLTGAG